MTEAPPAAPPVYDYWKRVAPQPFDADAPGTLFELQRAKARGQCYATAMRAHPGASRAEIERAIVADPPCAILFPELQTAAVVRRKFTRLVTRVLVPLVRHLVKLGLVSAASYPMLTLHLARTARAQNATAFITYADYILNALLNKYPQHFGGQKHLMRLVSERILPHFAAPRAERVLRETLEAMARSVA